MRILRPSAAALALLLSASSGVAWGEVFINEIHYDDSNGAGDLNESVEVVATDGEDLTQYRIVLYNGSGGAQYDDDALPAGSLTACGAQVRFATITYPTNGLQNGPPDGIALVGPANAVVQFLSYEGSFTAVGGPADGLMSTDIGVSETNATPVGQSLQLSGSGSAYADFTWQAPAASTFTGCNTGQTFAPPVDNPPTVVSTDPADAATDVAVGSLITINFNESIVVGNAAGITLDCGAGSLPFTTGTSTSVLSITPDADLPFGATCAVALTPDSITDVDGTADPMQAPFGFDFDTEVDNAPTLLSSAPADGAIDFPANADLQLVFSEPVALGASWFDITCSVSGARGPADVAISGGPSDYTLDPNVDFTQGESCVLSMNPAQITDLDGPQDALSGPNSIAFTPAAPLVNQPPAVLSTTPMQGDDNFPPAGDLVVLFSEQVSVVPGAFTLVCNTSTGISLSHAASGTSFNIDTGTALVAEDSCTFTIVAALVEDVEGANPAGDVVVQFTVASSSVGNYYQQVNTSSPEQLRCSLHETIDDHTAYPYTAATTDTWDILNLADEDPVDPSNILDAYKNESYTKITGGVGVYNREHTWPNTYGFSAGDPGAYTDTHMLYLTNTQYNADRGSKPFADCPACTELPTTLNHGVGGGGGGDSNYYNLVGSAERDRSFEVWDFRKGDMARALMYMVIRYEGGVGEPDLELTDNRTLITSAGSGGKHYMGLLSTLVTWHQDDPPDVREQERNQIVFSFQGNRNPFIDHPEWGTLALFQSIQPAECELAGGGNTAPVAIDDGYNAAEDTVLNVIAADGVLFNDTDADNDTLTAQLIANATNGAVALAADGSFSYTPVDDYCGSDAFTYRAFDGQVQSALATVSLSVACVNDAPAAVADSYQATEDSVLVVDAFDGVLSNDTDIDNVSLTAQLIANAINGSVSLDADGSFTYTPNADACGSDSFIYRAFDGETQSQDAMVEIAVACVNDAPVAVGSLPDRSAFEGIAITPFATASAFTDADAGDVLTYAISGQPQGIVIDPISGEVSGTPVIGGSLSSPYSVTVTAQDPDGASTVQQFAYTVLDPNDFIFADGFED